MSDYLDAEMNSRRRRRMEGHVGECEECRRLLAGLRALGGSVDAARVVESVRPRLGDARGSR